MISIEDVNGLGEKEFVEWFGPVFESSPWVAEVASRARPFDDLEDMHRALCEAMYAASREKQLALILAHPDLAGKAAIAGDLTEESTREQASAGLDRLSPEEYEAFTGMNAAYREKFGMPMIVCVREHDKESILREAGARLKNDREQEIETALAEISKIARYRLRDLVGPENLEVSDEEMNVEMEHTGYGKQEIRLVRVERGGEHHELRDLTVNVALEGAFGVSYEKGDNSALLATDTMRNTVYALAKEHLTKDIESFGVALVGHFLESGPTVEHALVRITEHPWGRIEVSGRGHAHSFVREAGKRVAVVNGGAGSVRVEAGLEDLTVLKTTDSGWEGFLRDEYTTLPETNDRILATAISASWSYGDSVDLDFDGLWGGVKERILQTFTDHYSPSVQNTLYRMGGAVLEEFPEVEEIYFSLPNKHHLLFDLSAFGMENENEIFHATSEPYGLIEGTVKRTG